MASNVAIPGTLAYTAIQWLRNNPDATTEELAAALNRSAKHLYKTLEAAVLAGGITRSLEMDVWIWNVGPEADVLQSAGADGGDERVTRVTAAVAAPSIFAYADQRGAAPFSVALSTDGRMSIERHGRVLAELTDAERKTLVQAAAHGVVPA